MPGMKLATAYYELVPSMGGAQGEITKGFTGVGQSASKSFGGAFSSGLGKSLKGIKGPLIAAGASIVAALGVKKIVHGATDAFKDLSLEVIQFRRVTGGSVEDASRLRFAVHESGVDVAKATTSFTIFAKKLGAGQGNVKKAAELTADLGTNFLDANGKIKPLAKILPSVADKFAKMPEGVEKTALATKLFGKSGTTLIPFLNKGSKGIKELTEKSDELGLTLNQKNIDAFGEYRAAGREFSATLEGIKVQLGIRLLPIFTKFTTFLTTSVAPAAKVLVNFFRESPLVAKFSKAVEDFFSNLTNLRDFIFGLKTFFQTFNSGTGDGQTKLAQFSQFVTNFFVSLKATFASAISILRTLWASFGGIITQYLAAAFSNAIRILSGAFKVIQGIFQVVSSLLRGDWRGVWDGLKKILSGAVQILIGIVRQFGNLLRFSFKALGIVLRGIFRGIWSGLVGLAEAGLNGILSAIKGLPGKIRALGPLLKAAGRHLLDALLNGLKGGAGFVSQIAGKIWDAVKGMLNAAIRKINAALDFKISIPGPDVHVNIPDIPQLAKGGIVNKPTLALIGEAGPEAVVPLSGSTDGGGLPGGPTADQIERLIAATEAARNFYVGQRQFATAVQDANRTGARL